MLADDAFGFLLLVLALFEDDITGPGQELQPFLPVSVGGDEGEEAFEECFFDGFCDFGLL